MSTANKLTYLNTTKQKLKQAINNIGGEITDETTFREYVQELQDIYDNLPKTSYAEGTEITLSNTLKGKLDFEDGIVGIGDTKQEIDLTENNLTSQSANGLTITVNTDKSITINGTASADTKINILNNTIGSTAATERTVEAGTYQLTGCPSGSSSGTKFTLQVLRSGYIMLEDTGSGAVNTITSSQTYTYIRIIVFSGTQCNNLVFRPKLLKIPSPSYPQEIEVVKGTQTVYIKDENNNIIDTKTINLGEYEFAKIGNYVDTIEYDVDEDKVYKNKAINKVSLKTLTWQTSLVGTNSYGTASLLSYIGKVATDINIICSHATGIIFNDRNWLTNTTIYDETNGYVVFRNTSFTSLEDFTTFLNNNNVYAYYVLATATREEITGTLKEQIKDIYNLMSYNGTTIITSNGNLPLVIKVRALKGE